MNILENIKEGLRSIQSNLLRTVLTALIVSIGIMSLVGILTAVDSIKYSIDQTFATLGANSFDIVSKGYSNRYNRGGRQGKIYPPISYLQARKYKEISGDEARVSLSAFISGATIVKNGNVKTNPNINVMAGDENYLYNENFNIEQGRPFSASELENGANVAIVGTEISTKLFKGKSPVNKSIYMLGRRFMIVGQLEKSGNDMGGGGADRTIIIPLVTGNQIPRSQALTYDIKTAIKKKETLFYAMAEATGIMRTVRKDALGQEDSFEITRSDSVLKSMEEVTGYLKIGGFLVGFITLLGASIGLMNIMMVSVTERTREIGVRKALGATARQIRQQFLVEAIVICFLGGITGVLFGVLMGNGVASLVGNGTFIVPWLWVTVGLSVCVAVGLISGYYPAFKASKLDPIDALRYE